MIIYGAGLAGLLAANMLRRHSPVIREAQSSLPNNHDALLRFRTDAVSRVTGIPFKKVLVHKAICVRGDMFIEPTVKLSNLYSLKVTGKVMNRSILNLAPVERFVAPPDLIRQMASSCNIRYDLPLTKEDVAAYPDEAKDFMPIISTIPMPILMGIMGVEPKPEFSWQPITTITADVSHPDVDIYQTIYYPGDEIYYRTSFTGRHLIIEMMGDHRAIVGADRDRLIKRVLADYGLYMALVVSADTKFQQYGKISPTDELVRQKFILAMSDAHRIYSVGRFATWRQILMDDVVHDVEVVERFITQRSGYKFRLAAVTGEQA